MPKCVSLFLSSNMNRFQECLEFSCVVVVVFFLIRGRFYFENKKKISLGTRRICELMFHLLWQMRLVPPPVQTDFLPSWFVMGQSQPFI